jgi:MazG family protein
MDSSTPPTDNALFSDLLAVMARLRSASGCPWDREQTHRSLRPCLLEETYEVLEAIDRGDPQALRQELGDLLLQVVFHAQLAAEAGHFDASDVVRSLRDKLIARHPHVFADTSADTPEEVIHQWDRLKSEERGDAGRPAVPEPPHSLPALSRAQVAHRRAARAGLADYADDPRAALEAALASLAQHAPRSPEAERALGDLLLAAVALAHASGVDAEQALRERVGTLISEVRLRSRDPAPPDPAGPG